MDAQGKTTWETAVIMKCAEATVDYHLKQVFRPYSTAMTYGARQGCAGILLGSPLSAALVGQACLLFQDDLRGGRTGGPFDGAELPHNNFTVTLALPPLFG
ncbi:LuxR C-terminal-related transcriptional regulator [Bradyrhizobium frederickii]|uniref:LuxR C-terminal-related transcriptional regulator n=1 Tax=Bradyrhizobium frederickii TaxID=2560054 RepID=UPI003D31CB5A